MSTKEEQTPKTDDVEKQTKQDKEEKKNGTEEEIGIQQSSE